MLTAMEMDIFEDVDWQSKNGKITNYRIIELIMEVTHTTVDYIKDR